MSETIELYEEMNEQITELLDIDNENPVERYASEYIKHLREENAEQKAEIERLTEEVKKIKEMTAEQVVESEKLKQSCLEAVNSFIRMETLYKVKCKELEIANKKLEELKGGKID